MLAVIGSYVCRVFIQSVIVRNEGNKLSKVV